MVASESPISSDSTTVAVVVEVRDLYLLEHRVAQVKPANEMTSNNELFMNLYPVSKDHCTSVKEIIE